VEKTTAKVFKDKYLDSEKEVVLIPDTGDVTWSFEVKKAGNFHIEIEYASTPDLSGKILILADTMLATGASLEMTYLKLCEEKKPHHTHLVCPIASAYAVEYL
jgi:uracil phosphoribosyltransferase